MKSATKDVSRELYLTSSVNNMAIIVDTLVGDTLGEGGLYGRIIRIDKVVLPSGSGQVVAGGGE